MENIVNHHTTSTECSPYIREKVISTYFERTKTTGSLASDSESQEGKLSAKAVLLDMEPKVVQKCLNARR